MNDEETDDVIKNPARQELKEHSKYVPNHIKLNIPVQQMDNVIVSSDNAIIDNNDFVNLDAINPPKHSNKEDNSVNIGNYILMIQGSVICTGDLNTVQPIISSILYNEHPDFSNVNVEDIILLKRVNIKCGVFIDE